MNFDHEELMLMMLYNTGTRLGLIHELRRHKPKFRVPHTQQAWCDAEPWTS